MHLPESEQPFDVGANYVIISGVLVLLGVSYAMWTCWRVWRGEMPVIVIGCFSWHVGCFGLFPLKSRVRYYETIDRRASETNLPPNPSLRGKEPWHPPLVRSNSNNPQQKGTINVFDDIKIHI